jgi:LCP family protein required for cell wall assembly
MSPADSAGMGAGMGADPAETLIREAVAAEADRAPDTRAVLAGLRGSRARSVRHRFPLMAMTATVVVTVVVTIVCGVILVPPLLRSAAPAAQDSGTPAPVSQNVLLAGIDDNDTADSIVLAHLDRDGAAEVISLPRDSWVNSGSGMAKLSAVYTTGGITKLVSTVEELTGVHVDHYATVPMQGFAQLSTAVGGVPVCLKAAVHDTYSGASFPAGRQVLEGASALAFLRQRHGLPDGDLDREARLQVFLTSLARELLSGSKLTDPDTLNALLAQVREDVTADPGWDLVAFAEQVIGLRPAGLRTGTIPITTTALWTDTSGAAIGVDPAQVRAYVRHMMNDTVNDTAPSPGAAAPTGPPSPVADTCVN